MFSAFSALTIITVLLLMEWLKIGDEEFQKKGTPE